MSGSRKKPRYSDVHSPELMLSQGSVAEETVDSSSWSCDDVTDFLERNGHSDIAKLFNGEMSRRAPERAPKDPFKFGARELKRVWHIACMSTLTRMRSE